MSQPTSASEPPIMATSVAVLDNNITLKYHVTDKVDEEGITKHARSPSTITETSDHSSSLLWQPQPLTNHNIKKSPERRNHRRKHKHERHHRHQQDDLEHTAEETSPFITKPKPNDLCSFEREYEQQRAKEISLHRRHSERHSSRKRHTKNRHEPQRELYNDYTKYEYHRRPHRDKRRKKRNSSKDRRDENSGKTGFSKIIQRIKEFFTGKKEARSVKEDRLDYGIRNMPDFSRHSKQHRHVSGKLFRSASDSDIEAAKHHRRHNKHSRKVKDDMYSSRHHWKAKRGVSKLSSIYESSDKTGERGSGSEGRLVLSKSGSTTYNDINYSVASYEGRRNKHREETGTSEGSHSHHSLPEYSARRGRHVRRSKDYRRLKKKWAKEHQSFENDLEKLERLVELVSKKKNSARSEQKAIEDTSLLERLEAKQEKCVAEVDFTRHVLVCKLQRLENKLEESLHDTNNNTHEERQNDIEDIRQEMSKECRDLRKLLQETSSQLKQVLEEKRQMNLSNNMDGNNGFKITNQDNLHEKKMSKHKPKDGCTGLSSNVPFPELSHHPLNLSHNRLSEIDGNKKNIIENKPSPTRVSTYV